MIMNSLNLDEVIQNINIPDIYEFSDNYITLSSGPMAGMSFDYRSSPIAVHLWPIIFGDPSRYESICLTSASQCGKTLCGITIPIIYLISILAESVIFAAPRLNLLQDKWMTEIYPMFRNNEYLSQYLLNRKSDVAPKLSTTNSYMFTNGTVIRLLSTQSSDRQKSSYTVKNCFITEYGGIKSVSTSEEADPIKQLLARTRSYQLLGKIFLMESTGTTTGGVVETSYQAGTRSEICCQCPNCNEWISPWRKDLVLNTDDYNLSYIQCPKCSFKIDDDIRSDIIKKTNLVSSNPVASSLSIKLSGFFNPFTNIQHLAKEEMELKSIEEKSPAYESKLKEVQNFIWGEAYEPKLDTIDMSLFDLGSDHFQIKEMKRGDIPEWTDKIILGMDIQLRVHFWTLTAWGIVNNKLKAHIIDYGIFNTRYEEEQNIRAKDVIVAEGIYNLVTSLKKQYRIDLILADIGYLFSSLIFFTNSHEKDWKIMGAHGVGNKGWRTKTEKYPSSGEFKELRPFEDGAVCYRVVDNLKYVRHTSSNERFYFMEMLRSGDLSLFNMSDPNGHQDFLKSLDSHFQIVDENGEVKWEKRKGSTDHHLDSAILTMTGYKVLNPTISFANKERYTSKSPSKQTIQNPTSHILTQQNKTVPVIRRNNVIFRRK